jgi:hypothetical protein
VPGFGQAVIVETAEDALLDDTEGMSRRGLLGPGQHRADPHGSSPR